MKRNVYRSLFSIFLVFSGLQTLQTCSDRDGTVSCFPRQYINFQINLNGAAYYKLLNPGGWDYTKGEDGTGSRGLIIYNLDGRHFKIYDRNAPHLCPDGESTTLEVITDTDGILKVFCPKDKAKWLMFNGEPKQNVQVPPKTYPYTITNGILNIYN